MTDQDRSSFVQDAITQAVRQALTRPLPTNEDGTLAAYTELGGFPLYYMDGENSVICPACAETSRSGLAQWQPVAYGVEESTESLPCDNCGKEINDRATAQDDADDHGSIHDARIGAYAYLSLRGRILKLAESLPQDDLDTPPAGTVKIVWLDMILSDMDVIYTVDIDPQKGPRMHQQPWFRQDNTEGYTDAQLEALNTEFAERFAVGAWGNTITEAEAAQLFADEVARR